MKNLLFTMFLLAFQTSFTQVENKDINSIKTSSFEAGDKENIFSRNITLKNMFSEIKKFELIDFKNNSEGKFSFNDTKKELFQNDLEQDKTSFLTSKKPIQPRKLNTNNLDTTINTAFVDKVIQKKIAEEIQKYMAMNESLTYGDRYLDAYKDFTNLENKLILSYKVNAVIEVQVGKDIYPFLKKNLKTELDKTLQNSLNLFAINF